MSEFNYSDNTELFSLSFLHIVSKSLSIAVQLQLDKHLSHQPSSIDTLAKQFNFHPQAFYRYLRVLDAYDIVELVDKNSVKAGRLLPYLNRINSPHILDSYDFINNLSSTLENNSECYSKTYGKAFFPYMIVHPEKMMQFQSWCTQSAKDWLPSIFSIYDFSKFNTIVDVAGGEGYFLASILKKNSHQRGILFDQPPVVARAATVLNEYAVNRQVEVVGGSFFDDIPTGGDVYTICRTLLNWNDQDAATIINNCHKIMRPNDTLLVIDFFVPEKANPHYKLGVANDINVLACFNSSIRTEQEWRDLMGKTNFSLKKTYKTTEGKLPDNLPMIVLEATV